MFFQQNLMILIPKLYAKYKVSLLKKIPDANSYKNSQLPFFLDNACLK